MNRKIIGLILNVIVPGLGSILNKKKEGIIQFAVTVINFLLALFTYMRYSAGSTLEELIPLLLLVYVIYDITLLWSLSVSAKLLEPKKDNFFAFLSFALSTGFMIPLFNIGICIISVLTAIKALRLIDKDSKHFGGSLYAYVGLAISASMLIVTIIFMVIFTYRKLTCKVVGESDLF